jgi:hypothetical protein
MAKPLLNSNNNTDILFAFKRPIGKRSTAGYTDITHGRISENYLEASLRPLLTFGLGSNASIRPRSII